MYYAPHFSLCDFTRFEHFSSVRCLRASQIPFLASSSSWFSFLLPLLSLLGSVRGLGSICFAALVKFSGSVRCGEHLDFPLFPFQFLTSGFQQRQWLPLEFFVHAPASLFPCAQFSITRNFVYRLDFAATGFLVPAPVLAHVTQGFFPLGEIQLPVLGHGLHSVVQSSQRLHIESCRRRQGFVLPSVRRRLFCGSHFAHLGFSHCQSLPPELCDLLSLDLVFFA
jgi:hypothetical protein